MADLCDRLLGRTDATLDLGAVVHPLVEDGLLLDVPPGDGRLGGLDVLAGLGVLLLEVLEIGLPSLDRRRGGGVGGIVVGVCGGGGGSNGGGGGGDRTSSHHNGAALGGIGSLMGDGGGGGWWWQRLLGIHRLK